MRQTASSTYTFDHLLTMQPVSHNKLIVTLKTILFEIIQIQMVDFPLLAGKSECRPETSQMTSRFKRKYRILSHSNQNLTRMKGQTCPTLL